MPARDTPAEGETRRLFLAVVPPAAVAAALGALARPQRGIAWVAPERMHLTLRFLGDTPVERLDDLRARLHAVAVAPFLLPVEGLGVFPPRGEPRVLWCGIGAGHPRLHQLRQQVDAAILAAGLDADLRTFAPHLTLARLAPAAAGAARAWLHVHRDFAAPPFRVDRFTLFASTPGPAGAVHTALDEFPLRA